jgi:hypothetical protein
MSEWTPIASASAPTGGVFDFPSLTLTGVEVLQIVASGLTVTTDASLIALTWYIGGSEIVTAYRWGHGALQSGSATALQDNDTAALLIRPGPDDANWEVGNAAEEQSRLTG